jgi:hypothetical protein
MMPIQRLRAAGTFFSCVLGFALPSMAQSTDNLGPHARDVLYQFSVGGGAAHRGSSGAPEGPLIALDVSAQMRLQGAMRFRVDAWMLDRRVSDSSTYYGQLVKSRTIAAIVSAEFPIRFSRNITAGPIVGAGFVPYLHGVVHYPGVPNEPSVDVTRSATGAVFSVGLALRWRGLVVEQFLHAIPGVHYPLNGRSAPLTIGWRF